ncbi:AAA family ATPase [Marichromatium bheemlicum]|uniref:AAA family ATPase n=1 Tax=Marichromatium bheemlicum TaxID=365339 RepID=A0ABX1IAS6_9GAMM|nr:AAA family ATPase [Marichromatium bheemlicum]NKN34640.1 AAA family ATPase [Marichromatium bheemlicum]
MISIVGSLKGGSGKSTVTFNLAVWLAMAKQRVRLIDADPQATLGDVLEVRQEEGFEPVLTVEPLSALDDPALGEADEVLIDVGTADMAAMRRALTVCDRVLVPVQPSQADIWSAQRYIRLIAEAGFSTSPEILGFINRGDTHHAVRETAEAAAALVALPGIDFIRQRLSQRTLFRRSFSEGLAVFELEPRGKGAHEFLALAAALYPHLV